jgi:hypothetical protein
VVLVVVRVAGVSVVRVQFPMNRMSYLLLYQSCDQVTINEYLPGQGIRPHVDTHSAFTDGIASISLLSPVVMDFRHPVDDIKKSIILEPRFVSFYVVIVCQIFAPPIRSSFLRSLLIGLNVQEFC